MAAISLSPLLALAALFGVAERHEIHATLTVATLERGVLELRIRVFADDFAAAVARAAGISMPLDSSVSSENSARYVRASVQVTTATGLLLPLASCGTRRVADVYLVCVRAAPASGEGAAQLRLSVLTDFHADQVNVVQFRAGTTRRSVTFTRTSPPWRFAH